MGMKVKLADHVASNGQVQVQVQVHQKGVRAPPLDFLRMRACRMNEGVSRSPSSSSSSSFNRSLHVRWVGNRWTMTKLNIVKLSSPYTLAGGYERYQATVVTMGPVYERYERYESTYQ